MTRPKYPDGLEAKGRRLWAEVKAARPSLGPGEALMLEEACRMFDRLDRLAKTLGGETFVEFIEDEDALGDVRTFTLHVNSAMAEARLTATALRGYMQALGLAGGMPKAGEEPGSGVKGGKRAAKVVGADEAATKPGAEDAADPLTEIERRRQQREQMG